MNDDLDNNGEHEPALSREERARWSQALSLESAPEDRAAIMEAAREYAALGRRNNRIWERFGSMLAPRHRAWTVADLITGAAIALSIFIAVQFRPWRKAAGPTVGWQSSTPAVFYGPDADAPVEPSPLPRPY